MNGEAGCILCSQARMLKAVFPVAKGYELKLYECGSCGSNLWLVAGACKSSILKRQRGRPPRGMRFRTIDAALKGATRRTVTPKLKGPPA